jgi:hypothetical protein
LACSKIREKVRGKREKERDRKGKDKKVRGKQKAKEFSAGFFSLFPLTFSL